MSFSNQFKTFAQWAKGKNRSTRYFQEIARKHAWAPKLSLKQLRLSTLSALDPLQKSFQSMSSDQKILRNRMMTIASEVRNGESLTRAARAENLPLRVVKQYLSSILKKENGRYKVQLNESIQRGRWMYSRGQRISITVTNKRDASLLSSYLANVQKALEDNDPETLRKFEGKSIKDEFGIEHPFETDLQTLKDLDAMIEDREELGIYDY